MARLWQTIQRRVILTDNRSSACYADQSDYCYMPEIPLGLLTVDGSVFV